MGRDGQQQGVTFGASSGWVGFWAALPAGGSAVVGSAGAGARVVGLAGSVVGVRPGRSPGSIPPVLCGAVFCGVPPRCVLCAVCVFSWSAGACCCSPLCSVLCVSWGVLLYVPRPLRSVRCCASLCWCSCVVLFVWCVLLLAAGAVVCCCVFCCFFWYSGVQCWVWWPVVVCWWRVSVSGSLSGRVVCFPVFGAVYCGALLPCVMFCGAVLSRGAVLSCSAVVLQCFLCLLCPPVACRAALCCAVLCYWLSVAFFTRRWRLCAVVSFPSMPARTKNTDYYPVLPRARLCISGAGR